MAERGWSWKVRRLPALGFLGAVLAAASGLAVPATDGAARAWWITGVVVGIVLSAGASAVGAALTSRQVREAERVEVDTRVALNDVLDPLVRLLGSIVAESSRPARARLQPSLVQAVLAGVTALIGPERVRACWFELGQDGQGRRILSPAVDGSAGRADLPRTTFVEGTPAGDAALALVDGNVDRFCRDVDRDPPPGWSTGTVRSYLTFISVPAVCAGKGYGMVSIDGQNPGDLTIDDQSLLRLMAGLLAAGLAR